MPSLIFSWNKNVLCSLGGARNNKNEGGETKNVKKKYESNVAQIHKPRGSDWVNFNLIFQKI